MPSKRFAAASSINTVKSAAEWAFNEACAERLRARGHEVHLPQDDEPSAEPGVIFRRCVRALEASDVVVACLDGPDPDSGTSWEVGRASGRGVPTVAFRTDYRLAESPGMGRCNLMLLQSATVVVTEPCGDDLDLLADCLCAAAKKAVERRACT